MSRIRLRGEIKVLECSMFRTRICVCRSAEEAQMDKQKRRPFANMENVIFERAEVGNGMRWRYHYLCGKQMIAKAMFDYPDDVTDEECEIMDGVVLVLQDTIDGMMREAAINRFEMKNRIPARYV